MQPNAGGQLLPKAGASIIDEAARLRREYGVRTGLQRASYFEIRHERFTLLVVDTGVLRSLDADQEAWLRSALERARGTFTFVILGHPLYAAGVYQGADDPEFAGIHQLLRANGVDVVMAGDTHDLEHYREPYEVDGAAARDAAFRQRRRWGVPEHRHRARLAGRAGDSRMPPSTRAPTR